MKSIPGTTPLLLLFSALTAACGGQPRSQPQANVDSAERGKYYSCTDETGRFTVEESVRKNLLGVSLKQLAVWEKGNLTPVVNGSGAADASEAWQFMMLRIGKYSFGRSASYRSAPGILIIYEAAHSSVILEKIPLDCVYK